MLKSTFIFLSILLGIINMAYSQNYQAMLDHKSEWQITTCTTNCYTDIYYTDGDTTDNGYNYTVLNGYHYISRTFWIRENIAEQKVYMSYIDPVRGREEVLLYDYSLNVGDTMEMKNPVSPFPFNGGVFEVDSIVSQTLFDGENYRVYYFSPIPSNPSTESPVWIESIGSLTIINAPGGTPDMNAVGKLSCYFDDGFLNYSQLDSISGCTAAYVTEIKENYSDRFTIYPTYCSDKITIKSSGQAEYFEIYNNLGQMILKQELESTTVLDLKEFKNGMYFIVISNSGQKTTKKFIKN